MSDRNNSKETFRDKLLASVGEAGKARVERALESSVRGSDRIEGIHRSRESYEKSSARELTRVPRDER